MFEKCRANCRAIFPSKAPVPHLWLRKNVFYCRIELSKVGGKRKYFFQSLHTGNYYEALTKMKSFENLEGQFNELFELYSQVRFIRVPCGISGSSGYYGFGYSVSEKKLDPTNDHELLLKLMSMVETLDNKINLVGERTQLQFNEIKNQIPEIKKVLQSGNYLPKTPTHITIKEVLEIMISTAGNKEDEARRKKLFIEKALKQVNLTLDDDYSKFHDVKLVKTISDWIVNMEDVKGDCKSKYLRYVKNLLQAGSNVDPDCYKTNIISTMPKISKTKAIERKGHLPYTKDELLKIFDSKQEFFKENPDMFWICMIALFTGSRRNASMTLQYGDVLVKDAMYCIYFNENHPIKHLKTDASERIVPIHKQLLDLGFVDYVERKKRREGKLDTDFIFPQCQTKNGTFDTRYILRNLSKFLFQLGIKKSNNDGKDFHSFRNNLSLAMQEAKISNVFINKVIGWKGQSVMENSYSKYTLAQIRDAENEFSYDFLQPEFDKWKKIMEKKPESKK